MKAEGLTLVERTLLYFIGALFVLALAVRVLRRRR